LHAVEVLFEDVKLRFSGVALVLKFAGNTRFGPVFAFFTKTNSICKNYLPLVYLHKFTNN